MSAPAVLWIRRLEGGPTAHVGTSAHLSERCQFLGFVASAASPPLLTDTPSTKRTSRSRKASVVLPTPWYAILHRFRLSGAYVGTDSWCSGVTASPEEDKARAEERLALWMSKLKFASLQDIHVRAFSMEIDGHEFGLVRENPTRESAAIRLPPLNLVFQSPWTGYPNGVEAAV